MPRALVREAAQGFRDTFGRDPQGVWSAPGRVSVMGDHTDTQDGVSLGFGIELRTVAAVATRSDGKITIATDLIPERAEADLTDLEVSWGANDWRSYPLGMIWAVLEHGRENPPEALDDDPVETFFLGTGLDVFITTDVPIGGGLSSSASICSSIGLALSDLWELNLDRADIAACAMRAERDAAGASTGIADHITSLFAEENRIVFYDVRGADVSPIDVMERMGTEQMAMLTIDTRESHRNWSSDFADRSRDCNEVANAFGVQSLREVKLADLEERAETLDEQAYRRARFIITETQRTLDMVKALRTEGLEAAGELLNQSHAALRDDYGVSTDRLELTIELARHIGAIGARPTGSGLGGSVFAVMPEAKVDEFRQMLESAYAEHGWEQPVTRIVSPSAGARRDV